MKEPIQVDVFVAGQDGYHTYRIPSVIVTPKGTVLAFCEGRKHSRSDTGDIDLVLKRSFDGGLTWQPMQIIADDGPNTMGNPCPVIDRDTGTIWLPITRNLGQDTEKEIKERTAEGTREAWIMKSEDDGATWSKPVEITADVKAPDWTWYATGPGVGIQLRSGRLVIPCDHAVAVTMAYRSHIIYSDDHGATWKLGGIRGDKTNECQVVELADGSLLLNMRNYDGTNRRAIARSTDGGLTWSEVTRDEALIEPVCQASFLRFTEARSHDKNRLLFSNPASTQRVKMTVRMSYDEGRTWPVAKVLHAGPSAYSCLTVLPDMTIGCLYERGEQHAYEKITFAKFDVQWLTDGGDRVQARLPGNPAAGVPANPKYLMLDSRVIASADNARLVVGKVEKDPRNPLFVEDKPWEPRFDNLYANVRFDEQEQLYKCWYSPFIIDERVTHTPREKRAEITYRQATPTGREMGICYAVSKDGITWQKPELGLVEFNGSKQNNIVLRGPHGSGLLWDPRDPDANRRYKLFYRGETMSVAFSPDGLHWSEPVACLEIEARGDTHNNAFWAEDLGKYVGITRLFDAKQGGRIVGRTESPDFLKWTKAEPVLRRLPTEPNRQTYAMPVFRYANVYLGLVMMFNTDTDTVDCELTYSPDTVHWERVCPGTPLIPRGPQGSHDWGCIYAAAYPVVLQDEIRLYYGSNNGPHSNWRDGFFCLAHLRLDGFAGMEPAQPDAPAFIVSRPVQCAGKTLRVSADAAGGRLCAGIMDAEGLGLEDCVPITSDVTDGVVTWKNGRDLSQFVGQPICLKFELSKARLYAFSFAD